MASSGYSDAELRGMVATGGRTIPMQQADLAKDLLAARRALRPLHGVLVSNGARQCAPEYLEIIKRALPPRGARGSRAKGGRRQR